MGRGVSRPRSEHEISVVIDTMLGRTGGMEIFDRYTNTKGVWVSHSISSARLYIHCAPLKLAYAPWPHGVERV